MKSLNFHLTYSPTSVMKINYEGSIVILVIDHFSFFNSLSLSLGNERYGNNGGKGNTSAHPELLDFYST